MAPTSAEDRLRLATRLLYESLENRLSWPRVRPAVLALLGDAANGDRQALIEALAAENDPAVASLRREILTEQMYAARRAHEARSRGWVIDTQTQKHLAHLSLDVEHGFASERALPDLLRSVDTVAKDLAFIREHKEAEAAGDAVRRAFDRAASSAALPLRQAPWVVDAVLDVLMKNADADLAGKLAVVREHVDGLAAARKSATKAALEAGTPIGAQNADEGTFADWFSAQKDPQKKLYALLQWPTDAAAAQIADYVRGAADEERACIVLTLRTGNDFAFDFQQHKAWLAELDTERVAARDRLRTVVAAAPEIALLTFIEARRDELGAFAGEVTNALLARVTKSDAQSFVGRWQTALSLEEQSALRGVSVSVATVGATALAPRAPTPPSEAAPTPAPIVIAEPEPPPPPKEPGMLGTLWREHLQGFIIDNWYLVLGLGLVLIGASLLAYYTWDKHWLIRYTLAPAMLAGFTVGVARLGSWLVGKDPKLTGSAALLRGTAVALLPLNFMTVALFADDPDVPLKLATVPLFALVYIVFAAACLVRWTSAMNPAIAKPFALTVVSLNALVFLAPLFSLAGASETLASMQPPLLAGGAYIGLVMCALFLRQNVLPKGAILADKTLVLFMGLSLLFTYAQTQLWVFGYLHVLPEAHLYALLFALAGYLVLSLERELVAFAADAADVTGEDAKRDHKKEASFVGYGLLGFAVLLSLGDPYMRIATLCAVGLVWLADAWKKPTPIGHWIGLTALALGFGCLVLVDGFPRPFVGPLVIALALGQLAVAMAARKHDEQTLAKAAEGMHASLLFLAAITVMGAQWAWHGRAELTGVELLAIAALLLVAGERNARLAFVFTAMFLVAFTLPYFGCVDLDTFELEGNLMPFGLAIAASGWLALVRFVKSPMLLRARSTTLAFYGALAVAALLVRLTAERDSDTNVSSLYATAELAGPIAMALIMVAATYFSRSWIPAVMAGLIVVVLVPDLKAALHIGRSTGFGSALIALALVTASFYLRRAPFLRELPAGDAWMFGEKFPFARHDHTLFTAPLILTMAILTLRTDSVTVFKNGDDPSWAFCAALLVTVISHTLLGVYLGEQRKGRVFVYLAVPVLYMGLSFTNGLFATWRPLDVLVATGVIVHLAYLAYTRALAPRFDFVEPLLAKPMRRLMEQGSLLTTVLAATLLAIGLHPVYAAPLIAFSFYQIVWHGHARMERRYGALLFALGLAVALAVADPEYLASTQTWVRALLERLDYAHSFPAALIVAAFVHLVLLACEPLPRVHTRWLALISPSHTGATLLALLLCLLAAIGGATLPLTPSAVGLIGCTFALSLIVARAERSVPIALFVYLAIAALPLTAPDLGSPVPLIAAIALGLVALTWLVELGAARFPAVFGGGYPITWLSSTRVAPAHVLALVICALGELGMLADFIEQGHLPLLTLAAGFVFASAVGLVARRWQKPILHYAGWSALAFANVLVAMTYLRAPFTAWGLGDAHVIAVGLGVTLLVSSALSYLARDVAMTRTAERSSTLLAIAIIVLLTVKYLVHPDLASMSMQRYAVSGVASYLAALYLRQAARRDPKALWLTALYHFGVTMALWCAALMLPPLRAPGAALVALGVPLLYFYGRAELSRTDDERARYADSATALSFVVVAVYTLRFAVQLLLFADTPPDNGYYHSNAPALIVLGLIMFRLHALRRNGWLATYGGLALMLGSFFIATWPARFSPFQHMGMAALVGMGLAHFWIAFAAYRSPLRSGLMRLGAVSLEAWPSHAWVWSVTLLTAVHVLFALAIGFSPDASALFAPLLFGLVTVVWHLASGWRSSGVFVLGGIELLLALHAAFLVASPIEKGFVVWTVLACFAVLLAGRRLFAWLFNFTAVGRAAFVLALIGMGHALYHHPSSMIGLLVVLLVAVLAGFTPFQRGFRSELPVAEIALVLSVPWLVYFSQAHLDKTPDAVVAPWPLHAVAATLLLLAGLARWLHDAGKPPVLERLGAAAVAFLNERHKPVQIASAAVALLLLLFVRYITWTAPLPLPEIGVVAVAFAAIGYGAWSRGRLHRVAVLFLLAEFCLEQIFETFRYQVVLTNAEVWRPEYDIVAMLIASLALAAVKELVDLEREGVLPVVGTLIGLPIAAISWTVYQGMSLDVALFIIGINSLIFAFMGRNQKESPYNVIAIFGFIAFLLSVFKGKLELTAVHAYVVPVGIGVLALVHLYERVLERSTRANIRLITLAAMLASAGYHALLDDRFPLVFHVSFILLSVAMMAVGGLFRVKLYLVVGFAGAMLDATVLLVKAVADMNRGPRNTLIGAFLLLTGAALVGGAIYYKAHKDELLERYAKLRSRFAGWE
ncbi:MAG: hypothetical protein IT381_20695 [Deltaproteobacteria bacterium]|nr:hypothetical protein [Deltaproteobacteria bacterium]